MRTSKVTENPAVVTNLRIFIGNIGYEASRDDVIDVIREAGLHVEECSLLGIRNELGLPHKGAAFAAVSGATLDQIIMRLHGRELRGRTLRVAAWGHPVAPPKEERIRGCAMERKQ
jgi:hypothetical protein